MGVCCYPTGFPAALCGALFAYQKGAEFLEYDAKYNAHRRAQIFGGQSADTTTTEDGAEHGDKAAQCAAG